MITYFSFYGMRERDKEGCTERQRGNEGLRGMDMEKWKREQERMRVFKFFLH